MHDQFTHDSTLPPIRLCQSHEVYDMMMVQPNTGIDALGFGFRFDRSTYT
jgi:hypothetical protein